MKTVLMVVDSLAVGGSERSLVAIAKGLREVEPLVVTVYDDGPLAAELDAASIGHTCLGIGDEYGLLRAGRRLRGVLGKLRPSVLHSSLFRSGLAARAAALGTSVPLVHSLVSEPLWSSRRPSSQRTWKRRVLHELDRLTSFRVDLFAANSDATATSFRRQLGIAGSRIRTVHRGRDPAAAGGLAPEHELALREELGVERDDLLVLNVGRLHPKKEQERLILALPTVLEACPRVVLVIAGEGECRDRLERKARELGVASRVRLLGSRDDVNALLALASVFVFPSLYEGLPGALIEAMHAAKPIVASDIPEHREALGMPPTGILVPTSDGSALAAAIVGLLREGRRASELGAAARQRARSCFTLDAMVSGYEALYLELAESGRGRARA